jgi:hypothetical protein
LNFPPQKNRGHGDDSAAKTQGQRIPAAEEVRWVNPVGELSEFSPSGPRGMGTPARFDEFIQLLGQHFPSDLRDRISFCDQPLLNVGDRGTAA